MRTIPLSPIEPQGRGRPVELRPTPAAALPDTRREPDVKTLSMELEPSTPALTPALLQTPAMSPMAPLALDRQYDRTPDSFAPTPHQTIQHTVSNNLTIQGVDPAVHAQVIARAGQVVGMAAGEVASARTLQAVTESQARTTVEYIQAEGRRVIGNLQEQAAAEIEREREQKRAAEQAALDAQVEASNTRGVLLEQSATAERVVNDLSVENNALKSE